MKLLKLVNRIVIFRILFIPFSLWIGYSAYDRQDSIMAAFGAVVLFFGIKNWCFWEGNYSID
jgi:hypothetical protein